MRISPRQLAELTAAILGGFFIYTDGMPACCHIIGGILMWVAFTAAYMDGGRNE